MEYPVVFRLLKPIENLLASEVRALARRYGFVQQMRVDPDSSDVWLWMTPDGYACLRIDEGGHPHMKHTVAAGPHAHKEWVPRRYLEDYLTRPPGSGDRLKMVTVLYDDSGCRLGGTHHPTSGKPIGGRIDPTTKEWVDGPAEGSHIPIRAG
jgi:hypothetical protein